MSSSYGPTGMFWSREVGMENQFDLSHVVGHAVSVGAIAGSAWGFLPVFAALVALIWYLIQIWESRTVQHYVANRRMVHRQRRINKLRAKEKVILAKLEAMEVVRSARAAAREKVEVAASEAAQLKATQEVVIQEKLPPV